MAAGDSYDVTVIGAGVSGLYTAWRLATTTDLKILVLEASDRYGGRFRTCEMPGQFKADLGAMRFSGECHPLLQSLVNKLEVKTQLTHQLGNKTNKFRFYTRNQRLNEPKEFQKLFSIADEDLDPFLAVNQFYFGKHSAGYNLQGTPDGNISHFTFPPTGQQAKDMTVGQYLSQTNNAELLNLSWSFYPPQEWQLAAAAATTQLIIKNWGQVQTISGGFEAITDALVERLNSLETVTIRRESKVSEITENQSEFRITVNDREDLKTKCKKVIYACHARSLMNIVLTSDVKGRSETLQEMAGQVSEFPCLKVYLTYRRPWWEEKGFHQGILMTDLPLHCIVVSADQKSSFATILAAYPHRFLELFAALDLPSHDRFTSIVGEISEDLAPSRLLVEHVHNQLKKVIGYDDLHEEPVAAVRMFWGKDGTPPMLHFPNLGVDSNQLHWKSLKPFMDAELYITGDTFASWDRAGCHMGFSEGALLTSERILVNYFELEPLISGLCLENPWPEV